MGRNNDGCILGNISGCLVCSMLDDEGAEATEEYFFTLRHGRFNRFHQAFTITITSLFSKPVLAAISLTNSILVISVVF